MSHPLFDRHRETLEAAVAATRARGYWSAYPEMPSGRIYGESAKADGQAAFQARLEKPFEIDQPGTVGQVGAEESPYGTTLGITYPQADLAVLLPAARQAMRGWAAAEPEARVGVCIEILDRINKRSFEMAGAVMMTTGQGFMMAFQAGGPHAQDRGLEAIAYAWEEMTRVPRQVTWEKKVSKTDVARLEKRFHLVPRGVAVVVGCSTFPTWNGYPGLFASLATGNAVVVKPHPGSILPLAITVEIAREVLREHGFEADVVTLAADAHDAPITKELVTRPEVGIVDYTGSSEFGTWVEQNATQAVVFTEKAGVNAIILDSVDDLKAVTGNIAFTVSLYSGQMCTTSQNIFISKDGVDTAEGHKSFDDVAGAIVKAVNWLLGDARRGAEILGAIQNERTLQRIDQAAGEGAEVLREASPVENEQFPDARVRSPLILKVDHSQQNLYMREMFGPIVYIVATQGTDQSIELTAKAARELGALTCSVYSTDPDVLRRAEDAVIEAGVPVSCNLTGQVFVNQSAAFSDFHVSGANPSGNATFCDAAFVATRFRVVQSRVQVPVEAQAPEAETHAGV
ncbi:MAG: phenylacetic acid degradation protein PaaN [Planctomycetes bacterium]|nr:phenylacetic acid degradation protein PaaN [Planctomycetota bacterium]